MYHPAASAKKFRPAARIANLACAIFLLTATTRADDGTSPTRRTPAVISIATRHSALVLLAAEEGKLFQLSFGQRPAQPAPPPVSPSQLDEFLPCYGNGYPLEPALQVVHADGNTSTELAYIRHEVIAESDNVSVTRITLGDRHYPFFVTLCFRVYRDEDVIAQWVEIQHEEAKPVLLGRFASAAPRFAAKSYWVSQFCGDVLREGGLVEERLTPGLKILDSKLTVRADRYRLPGFILALNDHAQEEQGEAIGGTLAWPGNFSFGFDLDPYGRLRVIAGISSLGAEYRLPPKQRFVTPAMLWSWSAAGKGQVSRNFHRWARNYGVRDGTKPRPVLLNNWETTFFDFNEEKLLRLLDGGKELGVDVFLLDDGWFSDKNPKNGERVGQGDWIVNRKILPHGLPFLVEESRKRGLGFGIWVEPESVHLGSNLYREHPDWVLQQPYRTLNAPGHQILLDLTRPAVRDFTWEVIDRVLASAPGVTYVKWDANRHAPQPGSVYLPPDEQQHVPIDYQWSLLEIMRRMAEKYPTVTAMLCSGGGGRVDYGSLKYFHTFWPSDGTDPLERIYTQWGYSHLFPAWAMCTHVTSMGQRPTKFAVDVALPGAFGIDRDVAHLSAEDQDALRRGVALYRERIRDFVQSGDLYRLESPYEGKRAVLSYVAEDRSRAVAFIYQLGKDGFPPIKLCGLDESKNYRVRELNLPAGATSRLALNDHIASGAYLMSTGFTSPLVHALESAVIEFVAEPESHP